jgi:hypothetical protein
VLTLPAGFPAKELSLEDIIVILRRRLRRWAGVTDALHLHVRSDGPPRVDDPCVLLVAVVVAAVAVIKVNQRNRFFGYNKAVNSLVPYEGTYVQLSKRDGTWHDLGFMRFKNPFGDITDGASNTFLAGEERLGTPDNRWWGDPPRDHPRLARSRASSSAFCWSSPCLPRLRSAR